MEQREFQRLPLRCRLKVQGKDHLGESFVETTELINISGGGALFTSRRLGHYVRGQKIETSILLPGTPDIQGTMTTSAKVVAVDDRNQSPENGLKDCVQVAVHFLEPFKLFRQNHCRSKETASQAASR